MPETPWGYKFWAGLVESSRIGASLKAPEAVADGLHAGRLLKGRSAEGETGMRVRALTSIFLLAAWLVPATGGACPSEAHEGVGHAHAHAAPEAPHDHTSHDHGGAAHGPAHTAAETHPGSGSSSPADEPICCARTADLPVVQAAAPDAKPRPELRTAILSVVSVVPPPPVASVSSAEFRRRQPPPLPYARSRRPLLI